MDMPMNAVNSTQMTGARVERDVSDDKFPSADYILDNWLDAIEAAQK